MLLLGFLLVVASGAFAGLLIAYNTSGGPDYTVTLFDNDIATLNTLEVFIAGLAIALVFCLGLWMMSASARLRRAQRRADVAAIERERYATAARDGSVADDTTDADTDEPRYTGRRRPRRHLLGH
jgi:uncharacterized membrane protein YciS (DUF1049 family)